MRVARGAGHCPSVDPARADSREPDRPFLTLDAAAPLISHPRHVPHHLAALRAGAVDAVLADVGSIEDFATVAARLAAWARFASADATIARTAAEIEAAVAVGRMAIVLHMQGAAATGSNEDGLYLFHSLGVRVMQLTYNYRNQLGDGCLEPEDAGLSELGRRAVKILTDLGVVLDISHAGRRTSLETIEFASGPVVASHANADAVCESPRNLSDDQIRAVAATDGVVGLCAFPAFVSAHDASLDRLVDHAVHISGLVGPDHVGVGLDYADEDEDDFVYYGYDERWYPKPPWQWPAGIEDWTKANRIPDALRRRGFGDSEIAGIMGQNFLRAFRARWGA